MGIGRMDGMDLVLAHCLFALTNHVLKGEGGVGTHGLELSWLTTYP